MKKQLLSILLSLIPFYSVCHKHSHSHSEHCTVCHKHGHTKHDHHNHDHTDHKHVKHKHADDDSKKKKVEEEKESKKMTTHTLHLCEPTKSTAFAHAAYSEITRNSGPNIYSECGDSYYKEVCVGLCFIAAIIYLRTFVYI